jgi:hypothetical protein
MISTLMARWIVTAVAGRYASGLVLFLSVMTLWNILFSPMYTSVPTMALAVGLVLAKEKDPSARPVTVPPSAAAQGL